MDREHEAIRRMQLAAKMSERYYQRPLLITNSGGKDSLVCLEIARRAGIEYEVLHSHTTADAPETVYYVRRQMERLEEQGVKCAIAYPTYKGQPTSMWSLIPMVGVPTRTQRFCCRILKETGGANRAVVTGVRRAESQRRSKRAEIEVSARKKDDRAKIDFEDASRIFESTDDRDFTEHDKRFEESCRVQGKTIFNPIIDWTDADVWDYIDSEHLDVNPIYRRYGLLRVGCVGCPMSGKGRYKEFGIWPKYRQMWYSAFDRMLRARKAARKDDTTGKWVDTDALWAWWMEEDTVPGQMSLEDFEEMEEGV